MTVESSYPKWFSIISEEYEQKISRFISFEVKRIRSKSLSRSAGNEKKILESNEILAKLLPSDFVILLDENGKNLNTDMFCRKLIQSMEGGIKNIIFIVGGAFGSSDELKKRANQTWKLSDLTMNHLVAQLVCLEQIYRTLTIWKGVPYHNE